MEKYPVIIIGAGVAGLTCANYLQQYAIPNIILEAEPEVGGRVRTDQLDGFQLDRGFQIFLTSYPEAKKLLDYKALQLKAFRSGAIMKQEDKFVRLLNPLKEPLSIFQDLFSPVGTLLDKIKILKLVNDLGSKSEEEIFSQQATSTMAFLKSYGWSQKFINSFFRPFFGGVFLEQNLDTSSNFFQFVFQQFAIADAVLPEKGIQAIPEQLASKLPTDAIRLNTRVHRIEGNTVYLTNGNQIQGEIIVLATDAVNAKQLTGNTSESETFNQTTCVYFSAEKSPLDTNLLAINSNQQGYINNMCVPSDIAPSYAPSGKSLISVSVIKQHSFSDGELVNVVTKELKEWFGEEVQTWQFFKSYRLYQALPSFNTDDTPDKELQIAENIYRCGDYTAYPSLNAAMKTGRIVAERVIDKVKNLSLRN